MRSQTQTGLEGARRMMSGHMHIAWYPYKRYEDEVWTTHKLQGKVKLVLAWTTCNLYKQDSNSAGLLVEFSYNPYINSCQNYKKETQFFSIFLPIFYFLFDLCSIFYFIGHMAQRRFQKDDIILYADLIANTQLCRVGQKWLVQTMRIQYIKVDYSVQSSPSSSLVLPNTRLSHNPTLRVLSYNIRT